uniref:Uncharacterized protein n=1 Tax=Glossina palpalis gambiensis TaxID=67801 RepID=A0A1B0B9M9_9MUSC
MKALLQIDLGSTVGYTCPEIVYGRIALFAAQIEEEILEISIFEQEGTKAPMQPCNLLTKELFLVSFLWYIYVTLLMVLYKKKNRIEMNWHSLKMQGSTQGLKTSYLSQAAVNFT